MSSAPPLVPHGDQPGQHPEGPGPHNPHLGTGWCPVWMAPVAQGWPGAEQRDQHPKTTGCGVVGAAPQTSSSAPTAQSPPQSSPLRRVPTSRSIQTQQQAAEGGRQGLPPRPPDPRGRMEPGARGARGTRPRSRSSGRRSRASECLQQAASRAIFSSHAFFTASQLLLQGWPGPTCGDKARAALALVRKAGSGAARQEPAVLQGQIRVGWPCPGYRAAPCTAIGSFHLLQMGPRGKHITRG